MNGIINATTLTALAKTLDKQAKEARDSLEPGEYPISGQVTLNVDGVVKVFENHKYRPTTSIPLKTALALFFRYTGMTGQNAMNALVRAMKEALEIEALPNKEKKTAKEAIRELADLDKAEATVRAGLTQLPLQDRRGKVMVKAIVEPVDGEAN
ncbi:MAG: hypothetical protein GF334_10245 [Candidatus Altiarchaeales archaeon]|nr:hypothetical protein [Candidatus Altiarchaeales archaeon]